MKKSASNLKNIDLYADFPPIEKTSFKVFCRKFFPCAQQSRDD